MIGKSSFLLSILVFAGFAIGLELLIDYKKILKHWKLIILATLIFVLYTFPAENFALSARAWQYSPDRILGLYLFGITLENIIFTIFTSIAIAGGVIILSQLERQQKPFLKEILMALKARIFARKPRTR